MAGTIIKTSYDLPIFTVDHNAIFVTIKLHKRFFGRQRTKDIELNAGEAAALANALTYHALRQQSQDGR